MNETSIEWADVTWNPTRGCSRVSEGCRNCYAERVASRFAGTGAPFAGFAANNRWTGRVELIESKLDEPLRWRKPQRVFVNSMSDLFHERLSDDAIAAVFGVMLAAPRHTFQVLTKRPERARKWFRWLDREATSCNAGNGMWRGARCVVATQQAIRGAAPLHRVLTDLDALSDAWPLPNVWLGVSVEDQRTADERIPELLATPAAVRFVSYEPALGPVDLGLQSATCNCCRRWPSRWVRLHGAVRSDVPLLDGSDCAASQGVYRAHSNKHGALSVETPAGLLGIKPREFEALPALDWVIVGGESGPNARPCEVSWIRSVAEQCKAAGVACFVKQDAGPRSGMQGRIPDDLWALKEFPR